MFTKLTLSMAKIIELRTNPIVKVIRGSSTTSDSNNLLDDGKIDSISKIAPALKQVLNKIVGPILTAIGMFAVIYAIYLGVQYAKAESADKRKEVRGRLIGACIGAVIIVVAATLCLAINWAAVYYTFTGQKHTYTSQDKDNYCDWCYTEQNSNLHGTGAI